MNFDAAGGSIVVNSAASAFTTVNATLGNGGTFILGERFLSCFSAGTITYGPGGGETILTATGTCRAVDFAPTYYGFSNRSAIIDDQALNFAQITGYTVTGCGNGSQTITVYDRCGDFTFNAYDARLADGCYASAAKGPITFANDGSGGTSLSTCFLRGTMIATPSGEVAVECLRAGDAVRVLAHGVLGSRTIRWAGGGCMRAALHGERDEAFPIRIRAGAFSGGVPGRDLLVTPEHCIFTPAGLTPARMLVNGASILIDRDIRDYDFFHVELDSHALLLAEGLASESYLDKGNRSYFTGPGLTGAGTDIPLHPDPTLAAPLAVTREVVEPLWTRLAERARTLGLGHEGSLLCLTDQPNLRLLLDNGQELAACWQDAQRHMFHIPTGTHPLRLLSRSGVPSVLIGPFVDDRRRLGVAVDRLVLWRDLRDQVIPAACLGLDGWHAEEGGRRWTNGDAALDLPRGAGETVLDVHVGATMLYSDNPAVAA